MDLNRLTSSHLISCHTSLLSRIEFTLDPTRSYNDRVGFSSTYSAIGTEGHEVGMAHDSFLDSLHGSGIPDCSSASVTGTCPNG